MENNSLAIRFTENKYATKAEVSKELRTGLVDNFWKNILEYRSTFSYVLTLETIEHRNLNYCLCPSIASALNSKELKLIQYVTKFERTSINESDKSLYELQSLIPILLSVADEYKIQADEFNLRSLITGKARNVRDEEKVLLNYYFALQCAIKFRSSPVDEDLVAELYSKITNNNELINLYRTANDKNPENKVIIDRVYSAAPANLIEPLMDKYFNFIKTTKASSLVKAAATFYFINYIKPFSKFNDEMALLLAKIVLSQGDVGEAAFYLELESFFSEDANEIAKLSIEVQKSNDLTYFLVFFLNKIEEKINKQNEVLNNLQAYALKNEYNREALIEARQGNLFEESKEEEEPIQIIREIPQPIKNEPKVQEPVVEEIKENPKVEVKEEIKETEQEEIQPQEINISGLAISSLPAELDEKQAYRLEEHLLETDPELRRGQAYFYARHCTMGKRYTIGQYKKELSCAYETARTSMDLLASLGYYRQEMVKNKKVYTPIKRK